MLVRLGWWWCCEWCHRLIPDAVVGVNESMLVVIDLGSG